MAPRRRFIVPGTAAVLALLLILTLTASGLANASYVPISGADHPPVRPLNLQSGAAGPRINAGGLALFGSGQDGDVVFGVNTDPNPIRTSAWGAAGSTDLNVSSLASFAPNQVVLIHQSQGSNVGRWEFNTIQSLRAIGTGQLILTAPLANTYLTNLGTARAQVIVVPQYRNVTVNPDVTLAPAPWDGNVGGILALAASESTTIFGTVMATGKGFRGGAGGANAGGFQGEGLGGTGSQSTSRNINGGGGACNDGTALCTGGGGGQAAAGGDGSAWGGTLPQGGGATADFPDLSTVVFGGGGGGGQGQGGFTGRPGNPGGGIVMISTRNLMLVGDLTAKGESATAETLPNQGGGGAGASGAVLLRAQTVALGAGNVNLDRVVTNGNTWGGTGSAGRIRAEYCTGTGSTIPPASRGEANCPTPTPTATSTYTSTPTPTATPTDTAIPIPTPTPTYTATPIPTPTYTATPTPTPVGTATPTPTLAAVATAIAAGNWTQTFPAGNGPAARAAHSAVYDRNNHRMIVFGGTDSQGADLNDTWSLSLSSTPTWSRIHPSGTGRAPSPRSGHTAINDLVSGRMIVFGGQNNSGTAANDVWVLSPGGSPTWTQVFPAGTAPPGRAGHQAVYDRANNRMLIFGGTDSYGTDLNDAWSLSLSGTPTWSRLVTTGSLPPARRNHSMVYDSAAARLVVFGGTSEFGYLLDDMWALSLSGTPVWTQIHPVDVAPSARSSHTAILDEGNQQMIIFGGWVGAGLNDVGAITLPGAHAWVQIAPAGAPPATRWGHSAVYDAVSRRMVVYGGYDEHGLRMGDVWALSLTVRPTPTPTRTATVVASSQLDWQLYLPLVTYTSTP